MIEDKDLHLEKITAYNHMTAVDRSQREKERAIRNVDDCLKTERKALQRRRRSVYRTAFHFASFLTAGCLIWGISEISSGGVLPGLVICLSAAVFGISASIFDCLSGE